jgi:hypothetical protein
MMDDTLATLHDGTVDPSPTNMLARWRVLDAACAGQADGHDRMGSSC